MTKGRPPLGPGLADHLDGPAETRRRVRTILETLTGDLSIEEACRRLGVGRSRFFELRQEGLQAMVDGLRPRRRGRPPRPAPDPELVALREENRDLRIDLEATRLRAEIALVMPQLLRAEDGPDVEKKGSGRRR